MKKTTIIIPLLAIAIASCGGGSTNQPQGNSTTTNAPSANTATTDAPVAESIIDAPSCLAKLPKNPDKQVYQFEEDHSTETSDIRDYYYAYPMSKGGYLVIYACSEMYEDYSTNVSYITFTYDNDGKLHTVNNVLPVLDSKYLLNKWNAPKHPAESKALTELFKKRPNDFAAYVLEDDKPIIRASLQRLKKEDPEWKEDYEYLMGRYFNRPAYRWDGEKFVHYDILGDFLKNLPKSPDKPFYRLEDEYNIMEQMLTYHYNHYAYPMTKGGYTVLSRCEISEEGSYEDECASYTYQNGKLDTARNVLPVPDINEWLDPAECKGNDSDVQNAIKAYKKERENLSYDIDEHTGNITPYHVSNLGDWCEMYSGFLKQLEYTWNGEKFLVPQSTDHIAMQVWEAILPTYDPYGLYEGEEEPSPDAETIAQYRKQIKETSPTIATFDANSNAQADNVRETIACYKRNNGNWLVIMYLDGGHYNNPKVFDYDGKQLKYISNYFSENFLSNERYISDFKADEFAVVRDTDEAEEVIWYHWNGDKFVKK